MSQSIDNIQMCQAVLICCLLVASRTFAWDQTGSSATSDMRSASITSYATPAVLTATIYSSASNSHVPLFKFKRTVTESGSVLHVLREYSYPDGKPAARERVTYRDNALMRYELDELQTGGAGSAEIERDPAPPGKAKLAFHYSKDVSKHPSSRTRFETLAPDTLVNDMVGHFLTTHWDRLIRGEKVGCRYLVIPRQETVGFTFRRESETTWHGRDVIILKMEPASMLISALVDPLRFVIEKAPPHRVLEYSGRTTPKTGGPGHWADLDAVTVFDW